MSSMKSAAEASWRSDLQATKLLDTPELKIASVPITRFSAIMASATSLEMLQT